MDKIPHYISQETQELFERFLLQAMDVSEEEAFLKRLEEEPRLNDQWLEFKKMFRVVEEAGLREKLDEFHQEFASDSMVRPLALKRNRNRWLVAASLAVLIVSVGLWFLYQSGGNQQLFERYFTPDPGLPTVMGTPESYDFYEAMVDYKRGDYLPAIEKWQRLLPGRPDNDTLRYFLGAAHLAERNMTEAEKFISSVHKEKSSVFWSEANRYLALILLQKGQREKAINLLMEDPGEENLRIIEDIRSEK